MPLDPPCLMGHLLDDEVLELESLLLVLAIAVDDVFFSSVC